MFVTCLFAILDPATGRIVFANAGHNLPYVRTDDGVIELRATGMPLGPACPASATRRPRASSPRAATSCSTRDGLVEAHDAARADVRLRRACARRWPSTTPAASCSTGCSRRSTRSPAPTGSRRTTSRSSPCAARPAWPRTDGAAAAPTLLTAFTLPGEEGNEREAMDRVAAAVADLGLPPARLERLKTAVSETAMNAIEYGSQGRADVPVDVDVETTADASRRPDHRPGPVRRGPDRRRDRPTSSASSPASRSRAAGASS